MRLVKILERGSEVEASNVQEHRGYVAAVGNLNPVSGCGQQFGGFACLTRYSIPRESVPGICGMLGQ